jgi:hypothetical protein
MRHLATTAAFCVLLPASASTQSQEVVLLGGRNQDTFLGCLSCPAHHRDSVWNQYSRHGFQNEYGTWNRYGQHASRYALSSACNPYSSSAPVIVDRSGNYYGRLSVNEYSSDSVCGPSGVAQICVAVRVMCADD